jgi:hypothetical protein
MGNTTSAVLDDIVQGSNCALFPGVSSLITTIRSG